MFRVLCALGVVCLIATATDVSARPKAGKVDKLEALFKKLDTNNDGVLSKEEFSKIKELQKNGEGKGKGKGKGVDVLYSKLNVSGDGKMTLAEFRKLPELRQKKKADK
jgi:Ca2+-binding EF-hand superfamily protein